MKNNRPMASVLVVGIMLFFKSLALAGWDWETGGKAGYDSNLDRAIQNPQGSGYLGAYLSVNRDPEGESRLDWTLSALADGLVYPNLSEVIRENVDRHALGLNVGVDWTSSFYSSAGYTYTTLQGESGTSNDHSVAVSFGYRF